MTVTSARTMLFFVGASVAAFTARSVVMDIKIVLGRKRRTKGIALVRVNIFCKRIGIVIVIDLIWHESENFLRDRKS